MLQEQQTTNNKQQPQPQPQQITNNKQQTTNKQTTTTNNNKKKNKKNNNNNKNSNNNNNKKRKNNKHKNATNRCVVRWLQATVWQEHHTVLCTCGHAQSTWTTPTLTLLYRTLMASPVCEALQYIYIYTVYRSIQHKYGPFSHQQSQRNSSTKSGGCASHVFLPNLSHWNVAARVFGCFHNLLLTEWKPSN